MVSSEPRLSKTFYCLRIRISRAPTGVPAGRGFRSWQETSSGLCGRTGTPGPSTAFGWCLTLLRMTLGKWMTVGAWVTVNPLGEECVLDDSGRRATVGGLLRSAWPGEDLDSFSGGFGSFVMVFGMTAWTIPSLTFFSIIRDWGRSPPRRGQEYPHHTRIWFLTTAIERK